MAKGLPPFSAAFVDLLLRLWRLRPDFRAVSVDAVLSHPWFAGHTSPLMSLLPPAGIAVTTTATGRGAAPGPSTVVVLSPLEAPVDAPAAAALMARSDLARAVAVVWCGQPERLEPEHGPRTSRSTGMGVDGDDTDGDAAMGMGMGVGPRGGAGASPYGMGLGMGGGGGMVLVHTASPSAGGTTPTHASTASGAKGIVSQSQSQPQPQSRVPSGSSAFVGVVKTGSSESEEGSASGAGAADASQAAVRGSPVRGRMDTS